MDLSKELEMNGWNALEQPGHEDRREVSKEDISKVAKLFRLLTFRS